VLRVGRCNVDGIDERIGDEGLVPSVGAGDFPLVSKRLGSVLSVKSVAYFVLISMQSDENEGRK
jgi:hypothetical protein